MTEKANKLMGQTNDFGWQNRTLRPLSFFHFKYIKIQNNKPEILSSFIFFLKHTLPIFSSQYIQVSTPSVQSEHFNCSNTYHLLCARHCHGMKGYCSEQITFSALTKSIDRRAVGDWDSALKDLTLRLSYSKPQHRGQSLKSTWVMQEGDSLNSGVIAQGARIWWKCIQGLKCWWVPFFYSPPP